MRTRLFLILTLSLAPMVVATAQHRDLSSGSLFTDSAGTTFGADIPDLSANCPPPLSSLHCVYYAGDFNSKPAKDPNGLFNQVFHNGSSTADGRVWVPIPIKKKIVIQGLFLNELFASPPVELSPIAHWEIRYGISQGNGGTSLCGGTETASLLGPTGRGFTVGATTYSEYTYLIQIADPNNYCGLTNPVPGNQDQGAIEPPTGHGQCPPNCYASAVTESSSSGAEAPQAANFAFLSDVPATGAKHHRGLPNVNHSSFFSLQCTPLGACTNKNFVPAEQECALNPPQNAITTGGCAMFSIGIIGTGK